MFLGIGASKPGGAGDAGYMFRFASYQRISSICIDDAVIQRDCKLEKERRLISTRGLSVRLLTAKKILKVKAA